MRLRQLTGIQLNENRRERFELARKLWNKVTDKLLSLGAPRALDIPGPRELEVWEKIVVVIKICDKHPEKMDNCKKYLLPLLNGNETALKWILSPNGRTIMLDIARDSGPTV